MFSSDFANYIIKVQIDESFHVDALNLIQLVPTSGILNLTQTEIAKKLHISEERFASLFEVLNKHKNQLIRCENNAYIFDYPEEGINYVKYFSRAMSNMGMSHNSYFFEEFE